MPDICSTKSHEIKLYNNFDIEKSEFSILVTLSACLGVASISGHCNAGKMRDAAGEPVTGMVAGASRRYAAQRHADTDERGNTSKVTSSRNLSSNLTMKFEIEFSYLKDLT
jgi:hypothetical protein